MATVALGFYGTTLDAGGGPKRWERWRPTVSLCQHDDLVLDRLILLVPSEGAAEDLLEDLAHVSPETTVERWVMGLRDPWDFEEVFAKLHDVARRLKLTDEDDLLVHITTGTHVAQICLFLLTEARFLPGRLLQTMPPKRSQPAEYSIIDLDRAAYDSIAQRFAETEREGASLLKQGIPTANPAFNRLMDELALVCTHSPSPILLTGPTGAGKSKLARSVYALKKQRHLLRGPMVEVNCATLRGDQAMSALFGHRRGAFTGAVADRDGLLMAADKGLLFLDEIGELGLDEQAMLLRAVEERRFMPVGSEREVQSDFQLIAGTNRDLRARVREGAFREDLLARIDLWTFQLPSLAERPEDIGPNIEHELEQFARAAGRRVAFNREAHARFLDFATGPAGQWRANFRDLNAAITRMATLAPGGRIDLPRVEQEEKRLRSAWGDGALTSSLVVEVLGAEAAEGLDRFDRVQLEDVITVCRRSATLSAAGRELFAVSRTQRRSVNDADRLRKYLAKLGLTFEGVCQT